MIIFAMHLTALRVLKSPPGTGAFYLFPDVKDVIDEKGSLTMWNYLSI